MTATTLVLAAAMAARAQVPNTPTDCATAMARSMTGATVQVCLAEAELSRAEAAPRDTAEWRRHIEAAAALYTRALALPADDAVKASIIERLLVLFDAPMLNQEPEMLAAFRELMGLHPLEALPLLRLAKYQEARGSADAAEETLLAARRLAPADIEPVRTLAQF
jgi:hypothetical protein